MQYRQYQIAGVKFLAARKRAYLGDGMRLGKTWQAAGAVKVLGLRNALVLCPASAVENWRREWSNLGVRATLGVMSYDSLLRNPNVQGGDWDAVIADEAHYLKSPGAKRTKRAFAVLAAAPRAWLLSGTPMPNHPGEFYTVMKYLWPEVLSGLGVHNSWEWFDRYCLHTPTIHGPRVYATKNADELNRILSRIMLRRTLQDVNLELPPLSIDVDLLPNDGKFVEELRAIGDERELQKLMEGEEDENGSVSRLRRFLGEYKAPRIASILVRELQDRAYNKIVVMAYHHSVLDMLEQRFAKEKLEWVGFRGGASSGARQKAIDEFTNGSARIFLAQQSSAGIAINLSAASELVLVEPDWSPDNNAQAIMRIQHINRVNPARARYFAVADTLDEAILKTNARKTRMQADILPKAR